MERKHLKRLVLTDESTVKPVLDMLAREKLLSTFGPTVSDHINPVTGRLHCQYNRGLPWFCLAPSASCRTRACAYSIISSGWTLALLTAGPASKVESTEPTSVTMSHE